VQAFDKPDCLPAKRPTVPEHWRHQIWDI